MASGIVSDGFIDALRARVPDLRLLTDETDRESYRHDETPYIPAGLPGAVALPTETAQVVGIVTTCAEFDVPIVPRGAGSGLSGGAAGIDGALTVARPSPDVAGALAASEPTARRWHERIASVEGLE